MTPFTFRLMDMRSRSQCGVGAFENSDGLDLPKLKTLNCKGYSFNCVKNATLESNCTSFQPIHRHSQPH